MKNFSGWRWIAGCLLAASLTASSGCKSASSFMSWRPKFMGGSTAKADPAVPTIDTPNGPVEMNKFSVQQPEGVTPVNAGGSILDQAPPPGTYPPGYMPQIQKVPFTDMTGQQQQ